MFESLLEQMLQKYLGRLIQGLNHQNVHLGVWSGNVLIENVSLKSDLFQFFGLPFALKFSTVGRLSMQVPWNNLSSSPVEVLLDRVYMIVVPQQPSEWNLKDPNTFETKLNTINEYAKKCVEKLMERKKQGSNKPEKSYFEKLKLIILDNVQLTLKNVHIRFENQGIEDFQEDLNYSWGVTLDRLELFTTDSSWKKTFYDRNQPQNKDQPMYKLLVLSSLSVYWNSEQSDIVFLESDKNTADRMENLIQRGAGSANREILSLSLSIKFVQRVIASQLGPEILLDMQLGAVHNCLQKSQLQQLLHLAEFIHRYQSQVSLLRKSMVSLISEDDKARHQKEFEVLYGKMQEGATLIEDEQQMFKDIVHAENIEELLPWTKSVVREGQKKKQFIEYQEKKKKETKGWFGGWFAGKGTGEIGISEEEKAEWESYFEKNFGEQSNFQSLTPSDTPQRPKDLLWFQMCFRLDEGSLTLKDQGPSGEEESLQFFVKGLEFKMVKRGENNVEIGFEVLEYSIDVITKYCGEVIEEKINFMKKGEGVAEKDPFLSLRFEQCPNDFPEGEEQPDCLVALRIRSARVLFNPVGIHRLSQFFKLKPEQDKIKDSAWQRIEDFNDKTQVI